MNKATIQKITALALSVARSGIDNNRGYIFAGYNEHPQESLHLFNDYCEEINHLIDKMLNYELKHRTLWGRLRNLLTGKYNYSRR